MDDRKLEPAEPQEDKLQYVVFHNDGKVFLNFDTAVKLVNFTPDGARLLALALRKQANLAEPREEVKGRYRRRRK